MSSQNYMNKDKRGSTLVVVMVVTIALTIIIAGLLSTMVTDKKVNRSAALLDEARNAAEGATEIAAAEFNRRVQSYSTIDESDPLTGFVVPETAKQNLSIGNVVADSIEFKAGPLSDYPESPTTISTEDPFNQYDPDKSKSVSVRLAYLYGKASSKDPLTGRTIDRHTSTLLQIRTQSWLNYGIFGNLDLEFHAGPKMDIYGPVHSNQTVYVVSGNELRFYDVFTTTEKVIRGFKDGNTSIPGGPVKFADRDEPSAAQLVAMSTSQDSNKSNFEDFARDTWDGYVQDYHFDIQEFRPPGMPSYVEDNYSTSKNETENHAYALIEPQLSTALTDDPAAGVYAGHKGNDIENLKASAYAGLTIRVKTPSVAAAAAGISVADYWARTMLDNDEENFEPGFELVYFQGEDSSRPINRFNQPKRGMDGRPLEHIVPINKERMSIIQRNRLFAAIKLVEYKDTGTDGASELVGTAFDIEKDDDTLEKSETWYPIYDRRQGFDRSTGANYGNRGAHHVLHIDMGRLNRFLNAASESDWDDLADSSVKVYDPELSYTSVIYVQFPLAEYSGDVLARRTVDGIRPAVAATYSTPGFALIMRNAKTLPKLPDNPARRNEGLVMATNGPAYVLGSFNADGISTTGSSREPDPGHDEIPALIAADSLTILSDKYADESSYFRDSAKTKNAATFAEVSAAVFAGVVPTRLNASGKGVDSQRMGGVHNYLRLLENWDGKTYRYRGSFALLFENEVHLRPYYEDKHTFWYSPPTRDTGYHLYFAGGRTTAWPLPVSTVRRITVADISAAEWESGPPKPDKAE